jgi:hypothetical protein
MTVSYSAASLREILIGVDSNVAAATLPTAVASPYTMWTVTGGRILLIGIVGQVVTAIGSSAQTLKFSTQASAAGSSAVDLCSPSANIANAAIGVNFSLPPVPGDSLNCDLTSLSGIVFGNTPMVIPAGVITLTSTATNTGTVEWDMYYVPLDLTAVVTPV